MNIQAKEHDQYEDIVIWDVATILGIAKEHVHNAFIARQRGDFLACSNFFTKALDILGDIENECPVQVAVLRASLERV